MMAGRLPQAWLDELRDRADIVQVVSRYVQLNPKGGRYWGFARSTVKNAVLFP